MNEFSFVRMRDAEYSFAEIDLDLSSTSGSIKRSALLTLEKNASSAQKVELLLAIARNYEALEELEQAVATYQRIVDSSTSFSLKNKAIERLAILQTGQAEPAGEEVQETTSEQQNIETKTTE